ncbi:MAG: hypothetical protein ACK5NT_05995 [Pyrinomonadaceae bacterium]
MNLNKLLKIASLLFLLLIATLCACYEPVSNSRVDAQQHSVDESQTAEPEPTATTEPFEENSNSVGDTLEVKTEQKSQNEFYAKIGTRFDELGYAGVYDPTNAVEKRLVNDYGAVFLTKAIPPTKIMFENEAEVIAFQNKAGSRRINLGGISIELQTEAAQAILEAEKEARNAGLSISPRGKEGAAKRSFAKTKELWDGRVNKALAHWRANGKIDQVTVDEVRALPLKAQVAKVFELEQLGIYFSTQFDKSILYSVAAPGASQHISMLALDVKQYGNRNVREILARHGWFRTVESDEPHFTYLGYSKDELSGLGLKCIDTATGEFCVPNV